MWWTFPVTISWEPKACIRKLEAPCPVPQMVFHASTWHFCFGVGLIMNDISCHAWVPCGGCTVYRQPRSRAGGGGFFAGSFRLQSSLNKTIRVMTRRSSERTRTGLKQPLMYSPAALFLITSPTQFGDLAQSLKIENKIKNKEARKCTQINQTSQLKK